MATHLNFVSDEHYRLVLNNLQHITLTAVPTQFVISRIVGLNMHDTEGVKREWHLNMSICGFIWWFTSCPVSFVFLRL